MNKFIAAIILLILVCFAIFAITEISISISQKANDCTFNTSYDNATICHQGILSEFQRRSGKE